MKYIGIKLADGSFFSILEEGKVGSKLLDLTTVQDNQTTVQIDLYRSATNTIDDAEYVDTLEIKNLKPHPNGEPDLHLTVSLDENNELNAEIIDPETGKTSETQVTLVSRTLAERNSSPINFAIDDTIPEPTAIEEPILSDDNTLVDSATEPTLSEADDEKITFDQMAAEIDVPVTDETPKTETANTTTDFEIDEKSIAGDEIDSGADDSVITDEELASIENTSDTLNSSSQPADTVKEDTDVIGPSPNNEDFSFDDLTIDVTDSDKDQKKKAAPQDEEIKPSEFDTSEFNKAVVEDTLTVPKEEEPTFAEMADSSASIEDTPVEETSIDDTASIVDLPDFSTESVEDKPADDTEIEEKTAAEETEHIFKESDYSVPDFDQPAPLPTGLTNYFEDPSFKDSTFDSTSTVDETQEKQPGSVQEDDPFADIPDVDEKTNSNEEYDEEDTDQKKTKTPVIICIICAIICVIATLLILFVIPSKINLIKSRNTRDTTATVENIPLEPTPDPAISEPVTPAEPEPVAPAKEDEVVVAPTPEVVPEQPAAPAEPPADIRYKIKWGDTLWDISDAYYKNPWRYKKLAKYNHIRNPNLIISGTYILIPAE